MKSFKIISRLINNRTIYFLLFSSVHSHRRFNLRKFKFIETSVPCWRFLPDWKFSVSQKEIVSQEDCLVENTLVGIGDMKSLVYAYEIETLVQFIHKHRSIDMYFAKINREKNRK